MNSNINKNKRLKKYNKELYFYTSNPNYEKVKDLYINGEIKSIPSAIKIIKSIKYKKDKNLYKTSIKKQFKLDDNYDDFLITKSEEKTTNYKTSSHISFIHNIPFMKQLEIMPEKLVKIEAQLKRIINLHNQPLNTKARLIVKDNTRDITLSTAFSKDLNICLKRMMKDHIGPKSREYQGNFRIESVIVSFIKINEQLMGASNPRSIEQATKKWLVVNPISKSQCVFHAVACCRNYKKNRDLLFPSLGRLKLSAKELKKGVKPTRDNYADDITIQEICEYVKQPINLYNNLFQIIKTFTPAIIKLEKVEYNIQRNNNHCYALIKIKELLETFPDFEIIKVNKLEKEENLENIPINKRRFFHQYNSNIGTWDIETTKNEKDEHIPYACSIAWMSDDKLEEKQFWGFDCLRNMLNFIYDNEDIFSKMTLYAHNGGKYDLPLLIRNGLLDSEYFQIEGEKCLELNNAWIGFTIRSKISKDFIIYFRDSFRLLPMSLEKLCNELDVKHKKLTETVSHNDITLNNYMNFPALKLYLTHDVFGLLEVMLKFGSSVFEELGIDITKCFTGASLSKINFFKNYYDTKYKVYSLSDSNDKFIRDGYFGGRVELFYMGDTNSNKIYYYDFTSLYPDVGRNYLPYGEPTRILFDNDTKINKDFFGFVHCMCKTKDIKAIPKHAVIIESRLVFPIFNEYTLIKIFSEEIDYDIYDYKFIEGLNFQKAKFKARFFNDGFNKKAEAKENNNPAMSQAYKIIINSGYGFWGLRTKDRDGVLISRSEDPTYMKYLHSDKLLNIMEHGDYTFSRVLKDLDVNDFNVGIAAAISSYARCKLHKLLTHIRKVGGEIYYCDTDSVICNINLNDYKEIKDKFQWDGNGVELGSLKNEADEYVEKLCKKLTNSKEESSTLYNKLLEEENGNFYWDKGIITGCKQYALKKSIKINDKIHNIEIVKLKGFSQKEQKLSFNDMFKLSNGENIQQEQSQFRCPKSNYVSETDTFKITTKNITKKFKSVYTKGVVKNNMEVSPIEIN